MSETRYCVLCGEVTGPPWLTCGHILSGMEEIDAYIAANYTPTLDEAIEIIQERIEELPSHAEDPHEYAHEGPLLRVILAGLKRAAAPPDTQEDTK